MGTAAEIRQILRIPGGGVRVLVKGLYRAELLRLGRETAQLKEALREQGREYYLSHPVGSGEGEKTALRALQYSVDASMVHNPSAIDVWVTADGDPVRIPAGQTVKF